MDTWQDFILPMIRTMISDEVEPYEFSDIDLQRKLLTAINLMQLEISFDIDYEADIVGLTLSPDPYTATPIDYDFMSLAALKAACMIERAQVTKTTSGDVQEVSDNGFKVKVGDIGKNKLEALKVNWCAAYEAAKRDYITSTRADDYGRAVISPFRYTLYYDGTRDSNRGGGRGGRWL